MGETTAISWTHVPGYIGATWNPWQGCNKVSEGCKNCYMFREKKRYGQDPMFVVRSKPRTFNMPNRVKQPSAFFVCSWSDFFHISADYWRDEGWKIMRDNPHHLFLIVTKRIERAQAHLPADWGSDGYPNVWLGVTAENQRLYDERVPILLDIPVKVHWISAEPLLEQINLSSIGAQVKQLDWVIIGGESGPGCRTMNINWVTNMIGECKKNNIPVFVKQLGGHPDKRDNPQRWIEELRVLEFPTIE